MFVRVSFNTINGLHMTEIDSGHKKVPIRILNAEPVGYCREAQELLSQIGQVDELGPDESLSDRIANYEVLVVRLGYQVNSLLIDKAFNLKAIVTATTGLDHVDVNYAKDKGINVLSLQGEYEFLRSVTATAEHTWGLLLTLVRNIPEAFNSVKQGRWERDQFRGRDLCGYNLGIVGVGRIGEKIALMGHAFGMNVGGFDPYTPNRVNGIQYFDALHPLLKWANVVCLHVPSNEETRHLIGSDEFAALSKGAYLINTSRGDIIEEDALLVALETGHLAGAALDVLKNETKISENIENALIDYARRNDNLVITPHIGGATYESMEKTEVFMAKKLKRFIHTEIV